MARLGDVFPVLRSFGVRAFCARIWEQVSEDNILVWASALAYSWLFAVFPFLIVLMSVIGHLPAGTRASARKTVRDFAAYTLPAKANSVIMDNIDAVMSQTHRTGLLSLGLVLTLWSASGGMAMTMYALDQCYDIKRGRPFYKQRPIAVALTVVVAVLVLAVFTLLPLGAAVTEWLVNRGRLAESTALALRVVRYALSMGMMLAVLAVMYYFGPTVRQRFRAVSPGAIFSVAVWLLLAWAFRLYVDTFGKYDQTYGAVGGVAILLLFFYIDAVVLLIGAEINSEIDFEVLRTAPAKADLIARPAAERHAETEMAAD